MAEPLPILVLAATEFEIGALRALANAKAGSSENLWQGSIGDRTLLFAVTGVGKSNAAFSAGLFLARHPFQALMNIGCAGAFPGAGLLVGDVVVADREIFADEGSLTPGGFLDLEGMELPGPAASENNMVPIRPPLIYLPKDLSRLSAHVGFRVRVGPLCTVSTCSGTAHRAAEVAERWHAVAESMEGAAVALAAVRAGLPFLEVRGISNIAGERRRENWSFGIAMAHAAAAASFLLTDPKTWPESNLAQLQ